MGASRAYIICMALAAISAMCIGGFLLLPHPAPSAEDCGFRNFIAGNINLNSYRHDKLAVNLHLDTIRLTGKKKGFIRLGFWKVLRMDDVTLDIYPPLSQRILQGDNPFEMLRHDATGTSVKGNGRSPSLPAMLDSVSGNSVTHAKGVEMHHITWRLHGDKAIKFKLTCGFAELNFKQNNFIFTDNVKIISAGSSKRTVQADRIEWDMERGILKIPGSYTCSVNGKPGGGKGLRTDLYLGNCIQGDINAAINEQAT